MPLLLNVLIDEDEQVVAGASDTGPLEDVAAVIGDDDDSLADDDGFDDLLDAADDDPDIAWLTSDGFAVCVTTGRSLPEDRRDDYQDLGRPEARALFVCRRRRGRTTRVAVRQRGRGQGRPRGTRDVGR